MITANSADLLEQTHHIKTGRWTSLEHKKFLEGLKIYDKDWKKIAELVGTRNNIQCRTHAQKHFKRIGSNNSFKENNKSVFEELTDEDTEKEEREDSDEIGSAHPESENPNVSVSKVRRKNSNLTEIPHLPPEIPRFKNLKRLELKDINNYTQHNKMFRPASNSSLLSSSEGSLTRPVASMNSLLTPEQRLKQQQQVSLLLHVLQNGSRPSYLNFKNFPQATPLFCHQNSKQ